MTGSERPRREVGNCRRAAAWKDGPPPGDLPSGPTPASWRVATHTIRKQPNPGHLANWAPTPGPERPTAQVVKSSKAPCPCGPRPPFP
eukprot:6962017-Pyramimonas_sp.AAC.1